MAVFNNQPTKFLKMEQQALRSQYKLAPVFQCILRGKKKERQKGETPSGLISQAGSPGGLILREAVLVVCFPECLIFIFGWVSWHMGS